MQRKNVGRLLPITVLAAAALIAACADDVDTIASIASFNCEPIDTMPRPDSTSPHQIIIKCDIGLRSSGDSTAPPVVESRNDTISSPWPQS